MAERIQVNFGWLNDYSGAKFAPLTLSDKVLMTNSDKTFDTYINEIITESRNRHTATENNVNNLKKTLKALEDPYGTHSDYPRDYLTQSIPENKSLILDVLGANRLIDLKSNNGAGYTTTEHYATVGDLYEAFGVEAGANLIPTYFHQGEPVACTNISSIAPLSSHLYVDYNNEDDYPGIRAQHPQFEITDDLKRRFSYGEFADGDINGVHTGNPAGLKVNIKGNARSAAEAMFSFQSGLAKESLESDLAHQAVKFTRNLKFSDQSTEIYPIASSHVNGLLDFNTITPTDTEYPFGLKLREILNADGTSKGQKEENQSFNASIEWMAPEVIPTASTVNTGEFGFGVKKPVSDAVSPTAKEAFYVPHVRVDTTGRIIEVTQEAVKPKLNTAHYDKVTGTKQAALLGYLKIGENESYIVGQSEDGTKGVYIDWDTNEPVVMGAAWNDYAEFRKQKETVPAGYCVASNDNGEVYKTTEKFQACDGIVSDTYGFSIGQSDEYKTPLAVSGRVLAYYHGDVSEYHSGDTVCAGPEGKICKMTREEIREWPDRIVGIVSEIPQYEKWNDIPTKGRIWIKVK